MCGIDLDVAHEEFVVLVGPSGCGKSTILRMIAGLEEASGGEIHIGDRLVNNTAPKDRNIAMVFQNYALYPHKTVHGNMAFALRAQRPAQGRRRAPRAAGRGHSRPRRPDGAQARRAVGRTAAARGDGPRDRPRSRRCSCSTSRLSNLDAELRARLRSEIKKLHRKLRATVVYVTHDQVEAMTLADRVVILNKGRIEQVGTPMEVYAAPANLFVAGFIGSPAMNMIPAELTGRRRDGACVLAAGASLPLDPRNRDRVRARHESGASASGPKTSRCCRRAPRRRPWSEGAVTTVEPLGAEFLLSFALGAHEIMAKIAGRALPRRRRPLALRLQHGPRPRLRRRHGRSLRR